jgi:Zinc knuckle
LMYCNNCGSPDHFAKDCTKPRGEYKPFKQIVSELEERQKKKLDKSVTNDVTITNTVTKKKHCPTCTCTRVYKSNADRQRAFRERQKRKGGKK